MVSACALFDIPELEALKHFDLLPMSTLNDHDDHDDSDETVSCDDDALPVTYPSPLKLKPVHLEAFTFIYPRPFITITPQSPSASVRDTKKPLGSIKANKPDHVKSSRGTRKSEHDPRRDPGKKARSRAAAQTSTRSDL